MTNEFLIKKCEEIIDSIIAIEYREEAKEIIRLTTKKNRLDFIKYFKNDQGNICCLVLDTAKFELIQKGIILYNNGHAFGNPLF